jgi:TonB family protein
VDSITRPASFQLGFDAVECGHPASYNLRSMPIPKNKGSATPWPNKFVFSSFLLCIGALCISSLPGYAQTPAEIEVLAGRTAQRVAKTRQQHIFVAGLQGCQLEPEICARFEASLRANLEKMVSGAHFAKRENVINILEGRGFIALDAYFPDVLRAVAASAGADILVTDNLEWQSDGYDFTSEVYDAVQGKKLDLLRAKLTRPEVESGGEPLVFKDAQSGDSMIIYRGRQPRTPIIESPVCERCPNPSYTPEAQADRIQGRVLLQVTITEQGAVDQVGVIDGLAGGLTDQALEAVRSWHFKPAIGKDGKPFAARMPLEVTFRLP